MPHIFSRNEFFWGEDFQKSLNGKHIAVFGLGGVGGFALEALARAGIGKFTIIDYDTISESNLNRQVIALHSTIGQKKTELCKIRLLDINPQIKVEIINEYYDERLNDHIFNTNFDFVIDAIDSMRAKLDLLIYCYKNNLPTITAFGAGNRLDPTQLRICDISEIKSTKCNFTKSILHILRKHEIKNGLTAIYSKETPHNFNPQKASIQTVVYNNKQFETKKITPSSTPIVAPTAGLMAAYQVLNSLHSQFLQEKIDL